MHGCFRYNKTVFALLTPCLLILAVQGCGPKPITSSSQDSGCTAPPADVFTQTGIDLEFAQSTFGKVVTGDLSVTTNPEVVSLASQAASDERMRTYLRCLAIKEQGYTQEQAAFLDLQAAFLATNPTPEQLMQWQQENPFPGGSPGNN